MDRIHMARAQTLSRAKKAIIEFNDVNKWVRLILTYKEH